MNEFKAFAKIPRLDTLQITITQKMHGTNAQIFVYPEHENPSEGQTNFMNIRAGSRTRWLTPDHDNYGFAAWVEQNRELLIELLGPGRHYGEWCGPGINSGEGLSEKTLFLFDWWKFKDKQDNDPKWPTNLRTVAVLWDTDHSGNLSIDGAIGLAMYQLMENGSRAVSGYKHPEGIVIEIAGKLYKQVFTQEETAWKPKKQTMSRNPGRMDVSKYMQPIRLEKILSSDEQLILQYPQSLSTIAKLYVNDLISEDQLIATNSKEIGRSVYTFIKEFINERGKQ